MATTFLNPNPQPGDGAWLLQQNYNKRGRGKKKVQSFLRQFPNDMGDVETAKNGPKHHETFLQSFHENGQEPTPFAYAPDPNSDNVPRTIRKDAPLSLTANSQSLHTTSTPLTSFLREPVEPAYTITKSPSYFDTSDRSTDDAMALPPHLRKKNKAALSFKKAEGKAIGEAPPSTNDRHDAAHQANTEVEKDRAQDVSTAPPNQHPIGDVRTMLEEQFGVKTSDPKPAKRSGPALVSYSSSNEDEKHGSNDDVGQSSNAKAGAVIPKSSNGERMKKSQSDQHQIRPSTVGHRGRGRGGGFLGRQPRESRWPKAAETKPDPHRWDINWNSSDAGGSDIDSACADAGFGNAKTKKRREDGIDEETGFQLTDWTGKWAPPPADWDARPAFRDTQSAQQIESWMKRIEEDMCGKQWAITTEHLQPENGSPSSEPDKSLPACEVAPRYWIPVVIGKQAPQTFWNELVRSTDPEPFDKGDLVDAKPWWELYQSKCGNLLKPWEQPGIKGIDPDETPDERIARESDFGSKQHTENRKRMEKAKRDDKRDKLKRANEKARKISESSHMVQPREKIKLGANIYIRSARPADLPRIREIYNYYVSFSVCTPETERRTNADIQQRYNDIIANKLPFLVACERGGKLKGRRKKNAGEDIILPDNVVGFAAADDYNDMRGMYRFTAEVEAYIDNSFYMKGVAKCLLDKLMGLLDPEYIERGGYDSVGKELEGVGPSRVIQNIVINMPYDSAHRLEWVSRWLTNWLDFKQVGDLQGIGNKDGKSVNLAIFQRTTGAYVDASKPPITMEYPS